VKWLLPAETAIVLHLGCWRPRAWCYCPRLSRKASAAGVSQGCDGLALSLCDLSNTDTCTVCTPQHCKFTQQQYCRLQCCTTPGRPFTQAPICSICCSEQDTVSTAKAVQVHLQGLHASRTCVAPVGLQQQKGATAEQRSNSNSWTAAATLLTWCCACSLVLLETNLCVSARIACIQWHTRAEADERRTLPGLRSVGVQPGERSTLLIQ
jgi:hypothetical protein